MKSMSPKKSIKKLSILSIFALILTTVGFGTYVYADKFSWSSLSSPIADWKAVAMTNASYGYASRGGELYRTSNGGSGWSYIYTTGGPQYQIRSIATSESGQVVLISYDDIYGGGGIRVSTNYGDSFSDVAPYDSEYAGVAMSEDGSYMYVSDQSNQRLMYSNSYGSSGTWAYTSTSYTPSSIATSNDGRYVFVATNAYIVRSDDYGNSNNVFGPSYNFVDVAVSADGQHVYAVPSYGYPQYSSNSGLTFSSITAVPNTTWKSVSTSGDGTRVVLLQDSGNLYSSRDYGLTFTIENSVSTSVYWSDVSLSSDGYTALLASSDNYLWNGAYDVTPSVITNITSNSPNGTYRLGQTIQLVVSTSETVYNSSLSLYLETGAVDRICSLNIDGASSNTCNYTVQSGDITSDLGTNDIIGTLIDDAGNSNSSHIPARTYLSSSQNIVVDGAIPAVSLTSPANGSTASGTVSLTATASDSGTGLVGVQFRVGTTNIGIEDTSAPYSVSWNSTGVADGTHTLHAVARDVAGNFATSSISVTVDNTAPVAPGTPDLATSSDTGNSSTDNITATTTPQFTVSCVSGSTVQLYRAGSTLIGSGTCSSSTVTITSATLTEGTHTITARQTDLAGNISSASTGLSITIDTSGPSVSITSPSTGSTTSGTIAINATATDSLTSVAGVLFSYGTTTISSEDTSSPYSVSFDTTTVADGVYTLNAVARDVVGNYATSTISITVTNTVATTTATSTTSTTSGPTQSSGPTAYSTPPSSPISGIYNPTVNNTAGEVISPTKAIASAIVQAAGISPSFNFTRNATIRTINNEVVNLQRMLNTMGYTVSNTGSGSVGNESSFFGPKTRLALIRFQRAFAIPTTGFFGPLSRAAMNRILNSVR
jgi:hypothetical protein